MDLFRVYDKENHRWITNDAMIDCDGGVTTIDYVYRNGTAEFTMYLPDEVEIEWNTRLEDDHNIAIYEGDIVRVNDEFIGEVRYIDFKSGFYVWFEGHNKFKKVRQSEELNNIVQYSDCVVIGNIHGLEREQQ